MIKTINFSADKLQGFMHCLPGQDRHQIGPFSRVDNLIEERHYVRSIDILVDYLIKEDKGLLSQKGNQAVGRKA